MRGRGIEPGRRSTTTSRDRSTLAHYRGPFPSHKKSPLCQKMRPLTCHKKVSTVGLTNEYPLLAMPHYITQKVAEAIEELIGPNTTENQKRLTSAALKAREGALPVHRKSMSQETLMCPAGVSSAGGALFP